MRRGGNWTPEHVARYRAWIDTFIRQYRDAGNVADCADLALESLVTYAGQNGLHVEITTRVSPRRTVSELGFSSYAQLARTARIEAGARNLADAQNTRPVDLRDALPGDLLLFNWMQTQQPPNIPHWHTMIFIDANKLWFGNAVNVDEPTLPDYVSNDKKRRVVVGYDAAGHELMGDVGPQFYLTHQDIFGRTPRRWRLFF